MINHRNKFLIIIFLFLGLTGCIRASNETPKESEDKDDSMIEIPSELKEIPNEYRNKASNQGTLIELEYETYESFSYDEKSRKIIKRAIVYLPYAYSNEKKYNVMYMMHGGWSNETTTLGTPANPNSFKNIIDNAIENNVFAPLIIVCPTYNNTNANGQDSDNYSLALRLNQNYHNELINDLIPTVESLYSTYATSTSKDDLIASRNHRAFCGFSMGSVAIWRTFENCLDYFRYFFPSSGAITSSGEYMDNIVKDSSYNPDDFFIWGMSGTNDFAYSQFSRQMYSMFEADSFIKANNEKDGNIFYSIKEGYSHDTTAQREYFYNALSWVWQKDSFVQADYKEETKISDVINDPVMADFARLIFPVNSSYYSGETLGSLRLTWYTNINKEHTVEICNYFKDETIKGNQVFFDIYSNEEKELDPSKNNTGLFFFRGEKNNKFAITCAGGGFSYVGAIHDSFPHALELSKKGYNAFAIIYRPSYLDACEDLAKAISFIFENSEALEVDVNNYSLWGGSAGGRMAATISSYGVEAYNGSLGIPKPSAAIIQYTGHVDYNRNEETPTFVVVGENDGIASYRVMKERIDNISAMNVETEFHSYPGLSHGFGLGIGTIAEGWIDEAASFWDKVSK